MPIGRGYLSSVSRWHVITKGGYISNFLSYGTGTGEERGELIAMCTEKRGDWSNGEKGTRRILFAETSPDEAPCGAR